MSYFQEIVLPSVGLPYKPTYTIPEALKILDCSRRHLYNLVVRGCLVMTRDKRIYCKEFEKYFEKPCPLPTRKKPSK